jgi:hypothetical protein
VAALVGVGSSPAIRPITGLYGRTCLLLLVIHQSESDRSRDDQCERGLAETYWLTWDFVARREGLEPPNRQIRSLPLIVRPLRCGPSVLLTSKNLVLSIRLVSCGPPVGL